MIKQEDWTAYILETFSISAQQAQTMTATPTSQTIQQHEDTHAYFALAYTAYAWNIVAMVDQKCLCKDCYEAWAEWELPAVTLAFDLNRWYTDQLDTYACQQQNPAELQEEARLKPEITRLTPLVAALGAKAIAECGINCPEFGTGTYSTINVTRPAGIPMLPDPIGGFTIFP